MEDFWDQLKIIKPSAWSTPDDGASVASEKPGKKETEGEMEGMEEREKKSSVPNFVHSYDLTEQNETPLLGLQRYFLCVGRPQPEGKGKRKTMKGNQKERERESEREIVRERKEETKLKVI